MKGIVFNLLEAMVRRDHGEDAWDDLLAAAGVQGSYTSLGSYPDEELLRLVAAASSRLRVPEGNVLRWFGRGAIALLADRYPQFFEGHPSTRSFVLSLNEVIHTEVRKLYPGAEVPTFDFDVSAEDVLVMSYVSRRRLCAFAEGLLAGAAHHYAEDMALEHTACMHRGDARCVFRVAFTRPATG